MIYLPRKIYRPACIHSLHNALRLHIHAGVKFLFTICRIQKDQNKHMHTYSDTVSVYSQLLTCPQSCHVHSSPSLCTLDGGQTL